MKKVFMLLTAFAILVPIGLSASTRIDSYFNMYPGENYYLTHSMAPGQTQYAGLKNIDPAGDVGQGDVSLQNFLDTHGSWIQQCSVENQIYYQGTKIWCSAPSRSWDGRTVGKYDYLYSGVYLYSELSNY